MRFKHLDKYRVGGTNDRPNLAVPVPQTPGGRVYRYSPNEAAAPRHFVLGGRRDAETSDQPKARMRRAPGSPFTVCPYSGVIAPDGDFLHPEDRDAAIKTVGDAAVADAAEYLRDAFKGIARRSKSWTFKPSAHQAPRQRLFIREDLLRAMHCNLCGRDYGVYAVALFCPDCGAPNVALHFRRETDLVSAQIEQAESLDPTNNELAYRLLGNAHEDVLTAFEATQKIVFAYLWSTHRPDEAAPNVRNDFQNVDKAKGRYATLGLDPFDQLDAEALAALELNIQKRHVIGHNLGMIDEKYSVLADDAQIGTTVELLADDIRIFAGICLSVVQSLDDAILASSQTGSTIAP